MLSREEVSTLLEAIVNNDSLGVTIIDKKGVTIFRNKISEKISGVKSSDMLGKHFSVMPGKKELLRVLETGIPQLGLPYSTTLGTKAIIHRFPLRDRNDTIIGAMSVVAFSDVMAMRNILEKYNLMKSKLSYYEKEIRKLREARYSFTNIVGNSDKIKFVTKLARKYASTNSPVLITGESGTGKELFAHAIHLASQRKLGPFIIINCPSIPEDLLESELFGYEPGAFSGASKNGKAGKFEMANGGTVFLDEISSLSLQIQPKLLRVLQDHRIERLGGNRGIEVDFRVIAATNKDLKDLVNLGLFREDLYYRLNVLNLHIPPLRERKTDIPLLADLFFHSFREESGLAVEEATEDVLNCFDNWSWPGNIRELKNVLEKAAISSGAKRVELQDLPSYLIVRSFTSRNGTSHPNTNLLRQSKRDIERALLESTLKEHNWNKSKAARRLGISRPHLYSLIKKYDLITPHKD